MSERNIPAPRVIDAINKLTRTSRQMLRQSGREPTYEELAETLGLPLEQVRRLLAIANAPFHLRRGQQG